MALAIHVASSVLLAWMCCCCRHCLAMAIAIGMALMMSLCRRVESSCWRRDIDIDMASWHWPCTLCRCRGLAMLTQCGCLCHSAVDVVFAMLSGCCGVHCCCLGLPACPAVRCHCLFMAFAMGARHHCICCAGVGVVSSLSSSRLHGYTVVAVVVVPAWVVGRPSDHGGGCIIDGAVGSLQTKQNEGREKSYILKHSCTV